jgi:hypothetical protein
LPLYAKHQESALHYIICHPIYPKTLPVHAQSWIKNGEGPLYLSLVWAKPVDAGPWSTVAGSPSLATRGRTTYPHGILAASLDVEHRLVGESEQARAIRGIFRIGGNTKAGSNLHL